MMIWLWRTALRKTAVASPIWLLREMMKTLELLLQEGDGQIGEIVRTEYEDDKKAIFVYATDCEGNIIELQR